MIDENLTAKNRIIVRVWLPRIMGASTSANRYIKFMFLSTHAGTEEARLTSRVGHVSLQLPTTVKFKDGDYDYISWWPDPDADQRTSLMNRLKATSTFEDMTKTKNYGYILAGNKATTRFVNAQYGESCCGLVYELINRGGANNLSYAYQDLATKHLIVTPDNFGEYKKS